jgi:ADP-ribose pyrophosphatase YjhB (NUDIX family)
MKFKFKFCPNCGHEGTVTQDTISRYICQNCEWEFWNNPSATVAIVFLKDGKALFAKRGIEPNKGKYDFPGGFVDYNEDIYDACVREIKEETTVDIKRKNLKLITGYTLEYLPGVSVSDLIFVVSAWEGDFVPKDDVAGLEWKSVSFINDPQFHPAYTGLAEKLAAYQ